MLWLILLLDFSSRTILSTFLSAGVEVDCGSKDISDDRSPLVCICTSTFFVLTNSCHKNRPQMA